MAIKTNTKRAYYDKIQKVTEYIHQNLDEPLLMSKLADIACLSEYHWHRIYTSISGGETVAQTVRRLRLNRAANELINTDQSIAKIAKRASYLNIDSFTRKFSEDFAISPSAYRKRGQLFINESQHAAGINREKYKVEVITLTSITVASLYHQGDYLKSPATFDKLYLYLTNKQLFNKDTRVFGLYYDDPTVVEKDQQRSRACFSVPDTFVAKPPIEKTIIPPGNFVKIIHNGPYNDLMYTHAWFSNWLIDSGYELRDYPAIEEYINDPHNASPADLITHIYIAIK